MPHLVQFEPEPDTLPQVFDVRGARRAQRLRRLGMLAMLVVVVAGLAGLLGVHTTTTTAHGDGYTATFTHARIARAGWDVPWRLTIRHPGGFPGAITVAINADAFEPYESQRFWPEPSSETRGGDTLYLNFDPPPGDTLVIDYDAYVQPSAQRGHDVRLQVVTDAVPRLTLHARTFLLP